MAVKYQLPETEIENIILTQFYAVARHIKMGKKRSITLKNFFKIRLKKGIEPVMDKAMKDFELRKQENENKEKREVCRDKPE